MSAPVCEHGQSIDGCLRCRLIEILAVRDPKGCPDHKVPSTYDGHCPICSDTDLYAEWERMQADNGRAVTVRLSDVKPARIDWLWPGRLARGKLHVIDGDPGLGKSTLTIDWAATLTTGGLWPDGARCDESRGVVILSAEDGLEDTIRPRLDAHGADSTRALALTGVRHVDRETGETYVTPPVLPSDLGALSDAIDEVDAAMVVVDPVMAYLGADVNSYRDQDIRRALAPLAKLAESTGVAVVIIRHLRKSKGTAVHAGGGSIGIIGAARIGYTVGTDPEDEERLVIACSKINIGVKPPALAYRVDPDELHGCARVRWLGTVDVSADQLTAERDQGDRATGRQAQDWLLGYLTDQGGEASRQDVIKAARAAGFAQRTVERAAETSKVRYRSGGFPRSNVWMHPDDHPGDETEIYSRAKPSTADPVGATGATVLTRENAPDGAQSRQLSKYGATGATGRQEPLPDWAAEAYDRER